MPRIPTVNPELRLSVANQPTMPASFGTAPGQAMQGLGRAISGFGGALEAGAEQENPEQEFQNKLAMLNSQNEYVKTYAESQEKFNPDVNDPDEWQAKQTQFYEDHAGKLRENYKPSTEKSRQRLELFIAQNRINHTSDVTRFAVKQRETRLVNTVTGAIAGEFSKLDPTDPATFDKHFDTSVASVEAIIDDKALPDNVKDGLRARAASIATKTLEAKYAGTPLLLPMVQKRIAQWGAELEGKTKAVPDSEIGKAPVNQGTSIQEPFNGEDGAREQGRIVAPKPEQVSRPEAVPARQAPYKIIDSKVPSSSERRAIFKSGGVVVNLDTNWSIVNQGGQTSPMVVIPDDATPAQRAAAQSYAAKIHDVYKEKFGKSLPPRVVTRSENGRGRRATIHTEPYAVTDKQAVEFFKSDEGAKLHAKILDETFGRVPGVHFSIPHNPDKGDNGAAGNGTNEVALAKLVVANLKNGGFIDANGNPSREPTSVRNSVRSKMMETLTQKMPELVKAHNKALEFQGQMQRVTRMVQGQEPFDKYDTDQKKLVDTWAEQTKLGEALLTGDLRVVGAIVETTKALNHLPTPFSSTLRTMAKSKDPKAQGTAYEVAASILTNNPNALDGDGLKDLREEAEAYREMLTGPSKLTTEEALGRIQEIKSDEWRKKSEARKEDGKKFADELDAGDTLSVFAGFFERNFGAGGELNPRRKDLIVGEYRERFREHFTRWGDKDLATQLAQGDMKRVYGMSSATGYPRVMRYPPERVFPPIGKDGHKYLRDDLKLAVQGHMHDAAKRVDPKAAAPEIDPTKIDIEYIENRTAQQIARGEPPRYRVIYTDPRTGIPTVLPQNWTLKKEDIETARAAANKGFNEAREKHFTKKEDQASGKGMAPAGRTLIDDAKDLSDKVKGLGLDGPELSATEQRKLQTDTLDEIKGVTPEQRKALEAERKRYESEQNKPKPQVSDSERKRLEREQFYNTPGMKARRNRGSIR